MSTTYQKGNGNRQQHTELITSQQQLNEAKAKLDRMTGEIEKIAGSLVSADELKRFTLNACVKNPKLYECFQTPEGTASVFLSIVTSRIIEIPCDGIHGYLVPFFDNKRNAMICQFMPGYKGYAQLAYQNQNVASVNCSAVFENDSFDFEYGTESFLRHKPFNGDRGQLLWAYAIVNLRSGHTEFRVLTREEVLKRKAASKSRDSGPWRDWEAEMWAKTAFLSLAKVAPMGNKVARAAQIDDRIQTHGNLTTQDLRAIEHEQKPALTHEPPAPVFTRQDTDDRRQTEPAKQPPQTEPTQSERPPEPPTAMGFIEAIEGALNATALKKIATDASKAQADGFLDMNELDEINSMIQEAKKNLK